MKLAMKLVTRDTIKKLVLVAMIALFAVSALTACGKKGKLENEDTEYPRHYPSR